MMSESQCPICFENKPLLKLDCTHTFCETCIKSWLPNLNFSNGSCPVCRQSITTTSNITGGVDKCTDTRAVGFNASRYWNNNPDTLTIKPTDVYKFVKKSLPSIPQFIKRYETKSTNHIVLELCWHQLDPLLRRNTRNKPERVQKIVNTTFWFGPDMSEYNFTYDSNRVEISTTNEDGSDYCTIYTSKNVKNVLATLVNKLLTPSDSGVTLDNLLLRSIHPGMTISLYDGKGFMHTEVFRVVVD